MLHHMNQDNLSREHLIAALQMNPDLAPARELLANLGTQSPTTDPEKLPDGVDAPEDSAPRSGTSVRQESHTERPEDAIREKAEDVVPPL